MEVPRDETRKTLSTSIIPFLGKAINESTIFGIGLGYGFLESEGFERTIAQKTTSYGGSIFLRKYKALGRGFSLFVEGSLGSGFEETSYDRDVETENIKGVGMSLIAHPGLSYTISKKLQLETSFNRLIDIGYTPNEKHTVTSIDNIVTRRFTTTYFNVSTSLENLLSFSLGLRVLISK